MAPISYRKKSELQSTSLSALAWLLTGLFPCALGRFASSQTCRLLSALSPFACVLSSAHHACPLLVNLANFSFSFISKFKYYVLCDTLWLPPMRWSCFLSSFHSVHWHQSTFRRILWNRKPGSLVERAHILMQAHSLSSWLWNVMNVFIFVPLCT